SPPSFWYRPSMRFLNTGVDPPQRIHAALTQANSLDQPRVEAAAREIVEAVRARGDAAVREYLRRFDGVEPAELLVSGAEYAAAEAAVDAAFIEAVETAIRNVRAFHERQRRESWTDDADGALLGQIVRPLERVGICVPSGKAPLPSSLIMAAVPARVAGVQEI